MSIRTSNIREYLKSQEEVKGLGLRMRSDPEYAWLWHIALAHMVYRPGVISCADADEEASAFMLGVFDVDTFSIREEKERVWLDNVNNTG